MRRRIGGFWGWGEFVSQRNAAVGCQEEAEEAKLFRSKRPKREVKRPIFGLERAKMRRSCLPIGYRCDSVSCSLWVAYWNSGAGNGPFCGEGGWGVRMFRGRFSRFLPLFEGAQWARTLPDRPAAMAKGLLRDQGSSYEPLCAGQAIICAKREGIRDQGSGRGFRAWACNLWYKGREMGLQEILFRRRFGLLYTFLS
jgi:hypothetical protein